MKKIRVAFLPSFVESIKIKIIKILELKFIVEIDDDKYDYIFAMETIYHNIKNFRDIFEKKKDAIRIIICIEAVYPDLNIFDYVICFDKQFLCEDRTLILPYMSFKIGQVYDNISDLDNSKCNVDFEKLLIEKKKFCNFIYSNAFAHPMRDNLFWNISKYKKVDSLGSHLNNVEITDTRNYHNWTEISINLKASYKFSITAENASFNGYTSEKILTSMMAKTIPIYWGNKKIKEEFNERSFINVDDYSCLDDLIEKIKEIDNNDKLWCDIMSEPWRTVEQIKISNKNIDNFYSSFFRIFEKDINDAKRRPEGTWPDIIYKNFFISKSWDYNNKIKKNPVFLLKALIKYFYNFFIRNKA